MTDKTTQDNETDTGVDAGSIEDKDAVGTDYYDPTDDEVARAIAEAEAEDNAAEGEGDTDGEAEEGSAKTGGKSQDDGKADKANAGDPMIPKQRFDQVLTQAEQARQEAAYWKGQADARAATQQTGKQQQEQGPTKEEQIDAQYAEFDKIDEAYQSGDITASQKARQEDAVREKIAELKAPPPKAEPATPAAPAPTTRNDLYLAEKTDELKAKHPYVEALAQDDLDHLCNKVYAEFKAEGRRYDHQDPAHILAFRTRVAQLSDIHGPGLTQKSLEELTGKPASVTKGDPKARAAADARERKIAAAEGHPPDISRVGSTSEGRDQITKDDIMRMSDDEIAALPDAVLRRHGWD